MFFDLYIFANGVAVDPNEKFALVCETFSARILKIRLDKSANQEKEVFAQGFPGYCDGISIGKGIDGKYKVFVAIPSPAPVSMKILKFIP